MSTKGLMAHKKVAEVTLNAAGKASTLTLADPWRYKGSAGPFNLTAVDHGHDIVKKARREGEAQYDGPEWAPIKKGGVRPSSPKLDGIAPIPARERAHSDGEERGTAYKGGAVQQAIYRALVTDPVAGHEIGVWLRWKRPMPENARKEAAIKAAAPAMKGPSDAYTEVKSTRWWRKDELAAKERGEAGSPWGREHIGGGDVLS